MRSFTRDEYRRIIKSIDQATEYSESQGVIADNITPLFTCPLLQQFLSKQGFDFTSKSEILQWYQDIFEFGGEVCTVEGKLARYFNCDDDIPMFIRKGNQLRPYLLALFRAIVVAKMNKKACGF